MKSEFKKYINEFKKDEMNLSNEFISAIYDTFIDYINFKLKKDKQVVLLGFAKIKIYEKNKQKYKNNKFISRSNEDKLIYLSIKKSEGFRDFIKNKDN